MTHAHPSAPPTPSESSTSSTRSARSISILLSAAALIGAAACTTGPDPMPLDTKPDTSEMNRPPEAIDGHVRLSDAIAVPLHYDVSLKIDPSADRFSGSVQIEIDVKAPTWFVQLHAGDLSIKRAVIDAGDALEAKVTQDKNGGLLLSAPTQIQPGLTVLLIDFEGELGEVPESLYRVKEGEAWYAYTQFEPLEARDAFPCFDDPGFKTPFRTTIKVPRGQLALSNSPEVGRKEDGEWTAFSFAQTKPLPTYLVALAVGDFDVVEAPADAIEGVPLRVVTTKGKGHMTGYVLEKTPIILKALTDYFGTPYPYAKLDLVAVPNFGAGAMENVGLVTFRETLLLLEKDKAPIRTRYGSQSVIAHELAHMWFGNLVTMAWWDDLWLNEAFATWMATRIIAEVDPALEAPIDAVSGAQRVMSRDAQEATRAIRQPIKQGGDVYDAFDGITYTKGASVLRMIEAWTGEEAFKAGVRDYLAAHAHGSATTEDLLKALDASSQKPVSEVIARFIDQPGTPEVGVEVTCKEGEASAKLSQRRHLPAGSKAEQGKPWRVPVCMRYEAGGAVKTTCALLDDKSEATIVPLGADCPTWLHPNADERGYYRWRLSTEATLALVQKRRASLTLPERVALPTHLYAHLEAGNLPADAFLVAFEALGAEQHRSIVGGVIDGLGFIHTHGLDEKHRKAFQGFVQKLLAPHLKRIGATSKPGEDAEIGLLRPSLIGALVEMGGDKKLFGAASKQASAFLKDPGAVPVDEASLSLRLIAQSGDAKLWESLKAAIPSAATPQIRSALLSGLSSFSDPALLNRSYALLFDGTLRAQDFWSIIGGSYRTDQTHGALWAWATQNYDQLLKLLGDKRASSMPWTASGFCSEEGRKTAADFFAQPGKTTPATERNLSLALESVDRCIRLKALVRPGTAAFFTKK